jgi:hypothetical protein
MEQALELTPQVFSVEIDPGTMSALVSTTPLQIQEASAPTASCATMSPSTVVPLTLAAHSPTAA